MYVKFCAFFSSSSITFIMHAVELHTWMYVLNVCSSPPLMEYDLTANVIMMVCVVLFDHGSNDLNVARCISVSHLFLEHWGEWEFWIRLIPGEMTPVSLSARLLHRPVLNWTAAFSPDKHRPGLTLTAPTPHRGIRVTEDRANQDRDAKWCLMLAKMLHAILLCQVQTLQCYRVLCFFGKNFMRLMWYWYWYTGAKHSKSLDPLQLLQN